MSTKPDLVITAVKDYAWEQIRPFVISLEESGFQGDKVILACHLSPFTRDCLENRGFIVVPFDSWSDSFHFVNEHRFPPVLKFLFDNGHKYRYVLWVDAGDVVFQKNPSEWLTKNAAPHNIIAARECWRVEDETEFNDPWMRATVPDEWDWMRKEEVYCGGTVAGDSETVHAALSQVYEIIQKNPKAYDQAALIYVLRKPFNFHVRVPKMNEGWVATCSAFRTNSFSSAIGRDESLLLDKAPIFDTPRGLVLTPDGREPFVVVHQYNRDARWTRIMRSKYQGF